MSFVLILATISLVVLAIMAHQRLRTLAGEPQIYAEVASELQQRAHDLLVRKDHIEARTHLDLTDENERWKNDLAQYMEDYEQEALARRRIHLGR
jgi:hypothetical protein